MIRIEASKSHDPITLLLSGRIQGVDLPELKRVMESYGHPVVLSLSGVKLVDREVVRFLEDFESQNGRITGCPRYIREWIRRERLEG